MKSKIKDNRKRHEGLMHLRINPSRRSRTKLRTKEDALALSQDRLRALVETTSDWIWEIDAQGVYTYVSPKVTELLDYPVEAVLGKRPSDFMPPEEVERIALIIKPIVANAQPIRNLEKIHIHKNGHLVVLETSGVPILDASGNLVGYRGIDRDITDRKQVEEDLQMYIAELKQSGKDLRQAEEKYRNIFENCMEGIYQTTLEGRFIGANPSAARLLGYKSPEDLINSVTDIGTQVYAYTEDRERAIGLLKEHGVFENFEMQYRKKDGGIAWGLHNLRFVRDEQGNVAYIEGTFQNITDRKQMVEALKEREHRFRSLSEASLEAILFIEDGIIVEANKALNQLLGYDGENLRGRVATDFIAPELRDFSNKRVRTKAEGIYETLGLRKDGSTIPIEINAREYTIDGRNLRITAVRDLTERKKMEQQLRDYQEHLEGLVEERTNELKKSEKKYRDIFENAQEGIFQSTPEGRLIGANPALATMFGSETAEELLSLINNIPEQIYVDPARRRELAKSLVRVGVVQNFELQFRCKDGVIKHASMNARAVLDEHGKMLYYEGTVQDITEKKEAEKALEAERQSLEEANTALKVLLKHRDEGRNELEKRFLSNIQQLVMPYVEKLKKSTLDPVQRMSLGFIESNLNELTSTFLKSVQSFNFTPRQLEVATLIREGRTTKDIAQILNMNQRAVEIQRFLIRKKLGFNKEKTNLQAYLKSLS